MSDPGYTRWLRESAATARALATRTRERGGPGAEEVARELESKADEGDALADEIDAALTGKQSSDNNVPMNISVADRQKRRRGHAVAAGKAQGKVAKAIVASRWKTQTAYAKRLRISQPSLSQYMTGALECPAEVDRAVRRDFPELAQEPVDALWPKGVRD